MIPTQPSSAYSLNRPSIPANPAAENSSNAKSAIKDFDSRLNEIAKHEQAGPPRKNQALNILNGMIKDRWIDLSKAVIRDGKNNLISINFHQNSLAGKKADGLPYSVSADCCRTILRKFLFDITVTLRHGGRPNVELITGHNRGTQIRDSLLEFINNGNMGESTEKWHFSASIKANNQGILLLQGIPQSDNLEILASPAETVETNRTKASLAKPAIPPGFARPSIFSPLEKPVTSPSDFRPLQILRPASHVPASTTAPQTIFQPSESHLSPLGHQGPPKQQTGLSPFQPLKILQRPTPEEAQSNREQPDIFFDSDSDEEGGIKLD